MPFGEQKEVHIFLAESAHAKGCAESAVDPAGDSDHCPAAPEGSEHRCADRGRDAIGFGQAVEIKNGR
jgi:hypothetical protein